jgi:hypothetical protein
MYLGNLISAATPPFRKSNTIFCNLSTLWEYAAVSFVIDSPTTPFYVIVLAGLKEVPGNFPIRHPEITDATRYRRQPSKPPKIAAVSTPRQQRKAIGITRWTRRGAKRPGTGFWRG